MSGGRTSTKPDPHAGLCDKPHRIRLLHQVNCERRPAQAGELTQLRLQRQITLRPHGAQRLQDLEASAVTVATTPTAATTALVAVLSEGSMNFSSNYK